MVHLYYLMMIYLAIKLWFSSSYSYQFGNPMTQKQFWFPYHPFKFLWICSNTQSLSNFGVWYGPPLNMFFCRQHLPRFHPKEASLWLLAADRELRQGGNGEASDTRLGPRVSVGKWWNMMEDRFSDHAFDMGQAIFRPSCPCLWLWDNAWTIEKS